MTGVDRNPLDTHANRLADAARFYDLLARLEERLDGSWHLVDCHGWMKWPQRGVYFFFEKGETRSDSGTGPRVVRVGTHGLKPGAQSTLWRRLSQHRGTSASGGGNHRGSIFRLLVGDALGRRQVGTLPESWGVEGSASRAARKLGTTPARVHADEAAMERRVSDYIGEMPFLWLGVADPPGTESMRGWIERNTVALLSRARPIGPDAPSSSWLGRFSSREDVRKSGLWNQQHTREEYDPRFLDAMERLINA